MRLLIQKIKKFTTPRTLSLATFLALFIALPMILGRSQQQTHNAHAQTVPNASTAYPIYGTAFPGDSLNPSWHDQTWFNDVNEINLQNKNPIYLGVNSMSWTVKAPWDELDLIAGAPVDISQYNYLTFYGQATQVGQLYNAVLLGTNGKPVGTRLQFGQYGGVPTSSYWTVYNFPLSAFNAGTTSIGGVGIADSAGGAQPPLFLDEMILSKAQGQQTTPTPQFGATVTTTPLPTPAPFYYPDISPWVFIIPGLIIFLAVIFQ